MLLDDTFVMLDDTWQILNNPMPSHMIPNQKGLDQFELRFSSLLFRIFYVDFTKSYEKIILNSVTRYYMIPSTHPLMTIPNNAKCNLYSSNTIF